MHPMTAYDDLNTHVARFNDILNTLNVLKWDTRTQMPPGGSETRGHQQATLARLARDLFVSDQTARLLDAAEAEVAGEPSDSYRVRAVQQTRQSYAIMQRIPADLLSRKATLAPTSEQVWHAAKQNNDFASFAPYLERMFGLARELADAIGYEAHPFDALVFQYEPGITAAKLRALFDDLKAGLLPLLRRIADHDRPLEKNLWSREYPIEQQRVFALMMAQKIGYDLSRGRLDVAPHPFEISFTRQDVRITTRYNLHYFPMALFGTLHETGHALYEQNIDPALTRTALTTDFLGLYAVGGTSYGAHEASSRLWENPVGRSRVFWEAHFGLLQDHFPDQLADADADLFYRSVNRVRPSLIRVEADEVTYNLHIMLRVEVEMGLLEGKISVRDLPDFWRAKMGEYLGVVPDTDSEGVLQDVHWSGGEFGAFPSYTIGNIMSAQLLSTAHRDVGDLDGALTSGDYQPLLGWLVEHFYRHGRAYTTNEILQQCSGHELYVQPYLDYLNAKFTDLYGLH
jgi:carboxypeptidase Taq